MTMWYRSIFVRFVLLRRAGDVGGGVVDVSVQLSKRTAWSQFWNKQEWAKKNWRIITIIKVKGKAHALSSTHKVKASKELKMTSRVDVTLYSHARKP